jgi:hypothetical protein
MCHEFLEQFFDVTLQQQTIFIRELNFAGFFYCNTSFNILANDIASAAAAYSTDGRRVKTAVTNDGKTAWTRLEYTAEYSNDNDIE